MSHPKYAIGIDPLVSGVSVAAFAEGGEKPSMKLLEAPKLTRDTSVAAHMERIKETADAVMESVTRAGHPEIVVMMKPAVGSRNDPTGIRRVMLAGEIQRRLIAAEIPVAEVPLMTLVHWLLGGNRTFPPRDFGPLENAVERHWGVTVPPKMEGFRPTTVAVAAAGAVLAGIPTRYPVTTTGLTHLQGMNLPRRWDLPGTEAQWKATHDLKTTEISAA